MLFNKGEITIPPKVKFSKEAIINVAFNLAKTEGIDSITVRKVADHLGSSIAPIYVNFTDIEELKKAVLLKIHNVSQEMLLTKYTSDPFLNLGIASIKFAREYSVLFKDLIMNNNRYLKDVQPPVGHLLSQMKGDSDLKQFSEDELMGIFFKMQVFQLGLSVMDVNGLLPEHFDEEMMIKFLKSAGEDVITSTRLRKDGTNK